MTADLLCSDGNVFLTTRVSKKKVLQLNMVFYFVWFFFFFKFSGAMKKTKFRKCLAPCVLKCLNDSVLLK